jgi:NAD(P)-dependent dehydrogenase (short-subunit alcohol dehydrogenase family)
MGFGKPLARLFVDEGCVVAYDCKSILQQRCQTVAENIRAEGGSAVAAQADVGELESVRAAVERAAGALGPITILVNNAGMAGPEARMGRSKLFWESDPAVWDRFVRTNTGGVLNCCHVVLPAMVAQKRGRIVTIALDSGRIGEARLSVYAAAKAGSASFVRSLARKTRRFGITCDAISPEELEKYLASDQVRAQLSSYVIRRFGRPDDVAAMTLFLCSEAASWITGQSYPVNGGYSFTV